MPIFSAVSGIDVWQKMKNEKGFEERAQGIIKALGEAAANYFDVTPIDKYSIRLTKEGMDAKEMQSLFAEKKVYLSVDGESLVASVGIASKIADVEMFNEAAKAIKHE